MPALYHETRHLRTSRLGPVHRRHVAARLVRRRPVGTRAVSLLLIILLIVILFGGGGGYYAYGRYGGPGVSIVVVILVVLLVVLLVGRPWPW